jgi:cell division protein FtsI (penicillin-binding protein 3)
MIVSVFAARLLQLQGLDAAAYAARQRDEGLVTEVLPASRGSITDRNGEPLADSIDGLMLVADPLHSSPDAPAIAEVLARRLKLDYFAMLDRLTRPDTRFQYLARRVPASLAASIIDEITNKELAGVSTRVDPLRAYPSRDVAANVLGFLNAEGHAAEGVELLFDNLLSGTDGSATFEVGGGHRIPLGDNSVIAPQDGHDIALTIDRDVQWYTQRVLRQAVRGARGDSGVAVVLDTKSGEVLALADYPSYDPNRSTEFPAADLGSRSVRDVYEPGSVEKVLTAAALLDAKLVTPATKFRVPGALARSDRVIHDYWDHGTLRLTMAGVIAKSSNVGTVLAANAMSPHRLWNYLTRFGLGSTTGSGLSGESAGVLGHWKNWRSINKDTIAFGQGVAVNALQMAAAVNTIANDGVYIEPSIIRGSHRTVGGDLIGSQTSSTRRVVSPRAAAATARMMEMVVDPVEGTAPYAAINGYRVAGKTGTAQRVGATCGCYDGTFTVSFAGFAPADDPRFVVYVVVQNPRNGGGGGSTGGPAFHQIMSYLLQKYAVPPTGTRPAKLPVAW